MKNSNKDKEDKQKKRSLTSPGYVVGENTNDELKYSKEEVEPFAEQSVDEINHDGVIGRDWTVDSNDAGE